MSRVSEQTSSDSTITRAVEGAPPSLAPLAVGVAGSGAAGQGGRFCCPFCGAMKQHQETPCPRCGLEDCSETRRATRARVGPWYVLQARNPSAPGMKFDTLRALIRNGQVTPRSIMRGPTTHQLWRFAQRVRGVSREFGICYGCGGDIETTASLCPHCHRMQEPPSNPDVLLESSPASAPAALPILREIRPPPPAPVAETPALA
ncbi:MAG TPA: hypothetical protein VIL86_10535, partial [Tepidisphaeraceae bacterium]